MQLVSESSRALCSLGGVKLQYNASMQSRRFLPDANHLSILMAVVLLAFALAHVLHAPHLPVRIPLFGIVLVFNLNLNTVISILTAGLAAAGEAWLLRAHPSIQPGETVEHWLLPMLTVLIIGVALSTLPSSLTWWLGFVLGGAILLVVFLAEYVVVEPADTLYPFATAALTSIAFIIFLILCIALRAGNARLFLVIPAVFVAGGLVALRTLHLRLNELWAFDWALGIAFVAIQIAAALHYWPLTPVRFGLVLLGPLYGLTALSVNLAEGNPFRRAFVEPLVMLVLMWGLTIWFW